MPLQGEFVIRSEEEQQQKLRFRDEIYGYRIITCLNNDGISDRFYVYVWDRLAARQQDGGFKLAGHGPVVGDLSLNDAGKNYQFERIELRSIQPVDSRRQRIRQFEFQYDASELRSKELPIELSNTDTVELKQGSRVKDTFSLSLGSGSDGGSATPSKAEHLLGDSYLISPESGTVIRLHSWRNQYNSFVSAALAMHSARMDDQQLPELTIDMEPEPIKVHKDNLRFLIAEETYGDMLKLPLPSCAVVGQVGDDQLSDLIRVNDADIGNAGWSPSRLIDHEQKDRFDASGEYRRAVETCTVAFEYPHYRNLHIL